jgi:hypothetical protein
VDTDAEIPLLNTGTEKGSVWVLGSALTNNSCGPQFQAAGICPAGVSTDTCPTQTGNQGTPWWYQAWATATPEQMSIFFGIGITGCTIPNCPGDGAVVSVLVEDVTADGTDAGFATYSADDTPADAYRYYDLARTDPTADDQTDPDAVHTMYAFPTVDTRNSAGPPPNTTVTNDYRDQGNAPTKNVWINAGGSYLPGQILTSYDIYWYHGPADPGRVRLPNWTLLKSVQYTGGPLLGHSVSVPCPTEVDDTYLAVGLSFDGTYSGEDTLPAGSVQTYYVGRSTAVECDPTLAEPEEPSFDRQKKHFGRAPAGRRGR